MLEVGILKNFDSGTYKAGVQLAGSLTTYFDNISVAKNIPLSALVIGNYVILAIPGGNPRDACVIATWPQGSPGGGAGSFLDLSDTPSSYSGQAGKIAKVNSGETALEFEKISGDNLSQTFGASATRLRNLIVEPIAGEILRIYNAGASPFSAKINGTPTATSVVYDSDTNEDMFNGMSSGSGYWGRIVLHNTTRGNSRKIVSVNLTTNTITTEPSTDDWADNDDITVQSQTNAQAGYFDVDVSAEVPATTEAVFIFATMRDNEGNHDVNRYIIFHPFEAYSQGKRQWVAANVANEQNTNTFPLTIIDQKFTMWIASGCVDVAIVVSVQARVEYADT